MRRRRSNRQRELVQVFLLPRRRRRVAILSRSRSLMRRGRTSRGLPCRPFSGLELPFHSSVCLSRVMYILVVNSMCAVQSDVVVNVYSVCVKDGQARSDCARAALDRVLSIFAVRRLIILRLSFYLGYPQLPPCRRTFRVRITCKCSSGRKWRAFDWLLRKRAPPLAVPQPSQLPPPSLASPQVRLSHLPLDSAPNPSLSIALVLPPPLRHQDQPDPTPTSLSFIKSCLP